MAEEKLGCARTTGTVVGAAVDEAEPNNREEVIKMSEIQVGKKAPDFEAPAYLNGEFTNIKLSDYLGKWVLLCFYPGDFTFV